MVPIDICGGTRILLSTGRALGYYDAKTGAIDTVYSLDLLQLPPFVVASPILWEESLVPVHNEDHLPLDRVAPPADRGRICDHPQHAGADDGGRSVFPKCQSYGGCQSIGTFYSHCCKRMVCSKCISRCTGHQRGLHIPIYSNSMEEIRSNAWPVEHPLVPDPDHYCYYYSDADVDVVRHVFISGRDLVLGVLPCRLTECAYRMDGRGHVIQTWARRYLDFDVGLV